MRTACIPRRKVSNHHPKSLAEHCADDTSNEDDVQVLFEAFEATPTCEQVIATKNALLRDFPGCAVSVPYATVLEPSFLDSLCAFLQQASTEYVNNFSSVTYKAAAPLPEVRNTSDPAVVTGLLMSILEANGSIADTTLLRKRVRDTVMFDKAYKPWRRSPFYLTVRVALQRSLYKQFGVDIGRLYYKTVMCLMLRQFLEDVLRMVPFESVTILRQKLGRRLAKLASDRTAAAGSLDASAMYALSSFDSKFEATLWTTGNWLSVSWRKYKEAHKRRVPLLSTYIPAGALTFRLPNAYPVLSHILGNQAFRVDTVQRTPEQLLKQYDESAASVKPYMYAARSQMQISQHHATVIEPAKEGGTSGHSRVLELHDVIRNYIHHIQTAPEGHPDEKSQMLLHLMELWVLMDIEATACYPLLEVYDPAFPEDLLDPIQLLSLGDMMRAKEVRSHLSRRLHSRHRVKCQSIFDDPSDDCFAARYFDEYDETGHELRREIEDDAEAQRLQKEAEWEEKSELHAETIRKRDETACFYDEVPNRWIPGATETKHRHPCEWHELRNTARNIRIRIFEHPLPSYEPAAKAAMFELRCPKSFAAYRNATWSILSIICSPEPAIQPERASLLHEYSQVRSYILEPTVGVTLASEKKAFLETHYAEWGFSVDLNDIIRSCGLKLKYYDQVSQSWTGGHGKASLWHHFPVMLAVDSPFRALQPSYALWPSSNDIQASQADRPADVSVHEFTAWQGLLVGTHSRWLDLIREMGSANLNFSADATWVLVTRMILQLGPAVSALDTRGDVHSALLDQTLCYRLLQQVQQRLDAIRLNWREPVQMDILVTILLKVLSLATSDDTCRQATALLLQARESTDLWRTELQSVVTNDAGLRPFAVWAALLCKRTLHADAKMLMDPEGLEQYIGASVSLNYNLIDEFTYLPWKYRSAIIRDVMFSYEHRELLRRSILTNPRAFLEAINKLWLIPEDYESHVSVSTTSIWWILLELRPTRSSHGHHYFVHYNYIYGTLLLDGQEMCTLPLSYRRNPLYRQIFGDRNPVVFPSPLQGMSWAVSEPAKGGQRIHLGFRQRTLVVRAVQRDELYEYVPAEVFGVASRDLPAPLIDGCHHWLNVRKGELEIRQQDMWISKLRNWWIYGISYGQCQIIRRNGQPTATVLLNSSNETVHGIGTIFKSFVELNQILVFASKDGKVTVELKPLELSFYINNGGLLQSTRLGAIITQQQDVGTLYGLMSKIVVQSVGNRRQRSVLVPYNSNVQTMRDGIHVSVTIGTGTDKYLKYDVNETLGRLDCPPEPSLLYTKALLHALTSHTIPDPLTSRTGVEESLRLLQTGLYQPWSPLNSSHVALLHRLAELSPMRGYYPVKSQFMETLEWRDDLTRHIQDDRFRPFAEKILRRHLALCEFIPGIQQLEGIAKAPIKPSPHLAMRALSRTPAYQPHEADLLYIGRDRRVPSIARANAFNLTRQLILQQSSPADSPSLLVLLHDASLIGGYDKCFQKALISDLLAVDVKTEWGALTQRAMKCDIQDRYKLMFLLGPISFSENANLDLLRKLITFVMSPDIKDSAPPLHAAYFHFRADGAPPSSYLVSFMDKARMPFNAAGFKKRSQVVVAENNHDSSVEKSCEALACSIQAQWPESEINIKKLIDVDPAHVDIARALEDLTPEWQRLTRNHELAVYLENIQVSLDRSSASRTETPALAPTLTSLHPAANTHLKPPLRYTSRCRDGDDLSLSRLLERPFRRAAYQHRGTPAAVGTLLPRNINTLSHANIARGTELVPTTGELLLFPGGCHIPEVLKLRAVVSDFKAKTSHVYTRYAEELETSIDALQLHLKRRQTAIQTTTRYIGPLDLQPAKDGVRMLTEEIVAALTSQNPQAKWLRMVDLGPKMTATELLTELRTTSGNTFGVGTKEALVSLGIAVTKLQQLLRIQDAQKRQKDQQQRDELANSGHVNWKPMQYPDWLLLEIDGNVMLREEQVQVALATIAPKSGQNSVLQLLMGKGKTSCILRKWHEDS